MDIQPVAMSHVFTRFPAALISCLALLLPVLSPAAGLEDWTLEQVLEKVADANGGKESIEGVTNVRIRGRISGPDNTVEFLLLKKRPSMMRLRLSFKGKALEAGYNGLTGWRRISQGEQQRVEEITGDDLDQIELEADFDGPLVGPAGKGLSRSLKGLERIDRVDYFIIEVTKPNIVSQHYVDSRTFRELKMIQVRSLPSGEESETSTFYHDYARHGGIWIAMRSDRHLANGTVETVTVEAVDVNPGILDRAFEMPGD